MRAFACSHCGQLLFFENSHCLRCGTPLGFLPAQLDLRSLEPLSGERYRLLDTRGRNRYKRCARAGEARCNWLVGEDDGDLCESCRLTAEVPAMRGDNELRAFAQAEGAKRRLLYQLLDLGLPFTGKLGDEREARPALRFSLGFSGEKQPVLTGHYNGLITLDLTECDNVHRERLRHQFGEPYRTLLGHFRHEVGHYFWDVMVDRTAAHARFRELFGDERRNYAEALKNHYERAPIYWSSCHVSAYASSHPWEDWAETFAHYLHIRDTLQTAATFGLHVSPNAQAIPPAGGKLSTRATEELAEQDFAAVVSEWLPLTYAFNQASRSMGKDDLYPFVLAPAVIEKLSFVHDLVRGVRASASDSTEPAPAAEEDERGARARSSTATAA
jgi:hypothetical protein